MVYCWNCGEENDEDAQYCSQCGSDLSGPDTSQDHSVSGDNEFEDFEDMVDRLLDIHIQGLQENISIDEDIPPNSSLFDKLAYGMKMFLMGQLKGEFFVILLEAAKNHDEMDEIEEDFSLHTR